MTYPEERVILASHADLVAVFDEWVRGYNADPDGSQPVDDETWAHEAASYVIRTLDEQKGYEPTTAGDRAALCLKPARWFVHVDGDCKCVRDAGHDGPHRDVDGDQWSDS